MFDALAAKRRALPFAWELMAGLVARAQATAYGLLVDATSSDGGLRWRNTAAETRTMTVALSLPRAWAMTSTGALRLYPDAVTGAMDPTCGRPSRRSRCAARAPLALLLARGRVCIALGDCQDGTQRCRLGARSGPRDGAAGDVSGRSVGRGRRLDDPRIQRATGARA